jgi:hypothetical protein
MHIYAHCRWERDISIPDATVQVMPFLPDVSDKWDYLMLRTATICKEWHKMGQCPLVTTSSGQQSPISDGTGTRIVCGVDALHGGGTVCCKNYKCVGHELVLPTVATH